MIMTKEKILRKHFMAEFGHEGHSKFMNYILAAMEEYAQAQIKKLTISDVSERYDLKVGYKDKDGTIKEILINAEDCDQAYNIFKKQFGNIKVEYID